MTIGVTIRLAICPYIEAWHLEGCAEVVDLLFHGRQFLINLHSPATHVDECFGITAC